jgi:integrase
MPIEKYQALKNDQHIGTLLRTPGLHADGNNLYLRVRDGRYTWVYRYLDADKRQRDLGLGSYKPDTPKHPKHVPLRAARLKAAELMVQRDKGVDPAKERDTKREVARKAKPIVSTAPTLRDCYIEWRPNHLVMRSWKYVYNSDREMEKYVFPVLGSRPVDEVTGDHIYKILNPIWSGKYVTAERLRGRLERILRFAKQRGYRSGENPASAENTDALFRRGDHVVVHQPCLDHADLPALMAKVRAVQTVEARCAEAIVLTGMRLTAIRISRWDFIDRENGIWTLPDKLEGMKRWRGPYRLHLTSRLLAILTAMEGERRNDFIFPGYWAGNTAVNEDAIREVIRTFAPYEIVLHGFRSTFADWVNAQMREDGTARYSDELREIALAHAIVRDRDNRLIGNDATRRAYSRNDRLEQRIPLMEAWDAYCCG